MKKNIYVTLFALFFLVLGVQAQKKFTMGLNVGSAAPNGDWAADNVNTNENSGYAEGGINLNFNLGYNLDQNFKLQLSYDALVNGFNGQKFVDDISEPGLNTTLSGTNWVSRYYLAGFVTKLPIKSDKFFVFAGINAGFAGFESPQIDLVVTDFVGNRAQISQNSATASGFATRFDLGLSYYFTESFSMSFTSMIYNAKADFAILNTQSNTVQTLEYNFNPLTFALGANYNF